MDKQLKFFTRDPLGIVIAAKPETGAAIVFNTSENKWYFAPKTYYQIINDTDFYEISTEQAQSIFKDILPDETLLDQLDSWRNPSPGDCHRKNV
jgi:hypothetical protein